MFSKLPGMKPTGKRPGPHHDGHDTTIDHEREESEKEVEQCYSDYRPHVPETFSPAPHIVASAPPILPPIPRVASQYGSGDSTSFGDLAKRFGATGTDDEDKDKKLKATTPATTAQPKPHQPPRRSELEVPIKSKLPPLDPNQSYARRHPSPRPPPRQQPPGAQIRGNTEPGHQASSPPKAPIPRPPSRESVVPRPLRDAPRPPSQLRESYTAPIQETPLILPPPPRRDTIPQGPHSASRLEYSTSSQSTKRPNSSSGSSISTLMTPTTTVKPPKPSRPMLNRLNPMAYLGRRRSTQPEPPAPDILTQKRDRLLTGSKFPDDYDPRIRGKVIHDFSAPRPRRPMISSDFQSTPDSLHSPAYVSAKSNENCVEGDGSSKRPADSERQHTPVFKEHFGEDIDGVWRYDENDRRNKITTKILDRVPAKDVQEPIALPPFARKLADRGQNSSPASSQSSLPQPRAPTNDDKSLPPTPRVQSPNTPQSAQIKSQALPEHDHASHGSNSVERSTKPGGAASPKAPRSPPQAPISSAPTSPPKSVSQSPIMDESSFQSAGLPKHLRSNASRFSFDLAGVGSAAQEKLLEDKHRQRAAKRARSSTISGTSIAESNDESDYDDINFDDGMEEEIPGFDADDDQFAGAANVANFTLGPSIDAFAQAVETNSHSEPGANSQMLSAGPDALGLRQVMPPSNQTPSQTSLPFTAHPNLAILSSGKIKLSNAVSDYEDDDLYFDDGDIDVDLESGEKFDETLFDDENNRIYGVPLRDQRPLSMLDEFAGDSSQQSTRPISSESGIAAAQQIRQTADTSRTSFLPIEAQAQQTKPSTLAQASGPCHDQEAVELTQDNLTRYHDALALAANKAASEGRFDRKMSIDSSAPKAATNEEPRVSFNEQEFGAGMRPLSDESGFKFDDYDDVADDEFIAAANAEALENDDEGFYGQEFGFYARSSDVNEANYMNGGYFGPAKDLPKRSHSGRAGGQDPSLTPITERSEWSQRNSMISLAHGSYPPGFQNQGLAQLADALQHEEQDDMSLSTLYKLRRGAFGASSSSLHSNSGSQKSGSPPVFGLASPPLGTGSSGFQFGGGAASISSPNLHMSTSMVSSPTEEYMPSVTSPLVSLHNQSLVLSPTNRGNSSGSDTSPKRRNAVGKGHSRNSSGAGSVSYVEDGYGGWLQETRRTGEDGQVEVLGRQHVEGGRI